MLVPSALNLEDVSFKSYKRKAHMRQRYKSKKKLKNATEKKEIENYWWEAKTQSRSKSIIYNIETKKDIQNTFRYLKIPKIFGTLQSKLFLRVNIIPLPISLQKSGASLLFKLKLWIKNWQTEKIMQHRSVFRILSNTLRLGYLTGFWILTPLQQPPRL